MVSARMMETTFLIFVPSYFLSYYGFFTIGLFIIHKNNNKVNVNAPAFHLVF